MKTTYKVVVHEEAEGGYWAELPGCFTRGETLDALYQHLVGAIACHLDVDISSIRIGLLEMAVA